MLIVTFIFLIVTAFSLRRHHGILFCGVPIILIGYFFISTAIFEFGTDVPIVSYQISHVPSYYDTLLYFSLYPLAIVYAKYLASLIVRPPARIMPRFSGEARVNTALRSSNSRRVDVLLFFIGILPALAIVYGAEPADLIKRNTFPVEFSSSRIMVFADSLFWVSIMLIPFIRNRVLRFLGLCLLVTGFAAAGERQSVVAFWIFIVVDRFVVRRKSGVLHGLLFAFSIWLLTHLIAIRYDWAGGVLLLGEKLIFPSSDDVAFLAFALNYMSNSSVIINTLSLAKLEASKFLYYYSINPLPSFLLEGSEVYIEEARLQSHVPFPGYALALKYLGGLRFFLVFFSIFFIFDVIRNKFVVRRPLPEMLVYSAVGLIPYLFSLQYNLRASSRLFYALLVVYICVAFFSKYKFRFKLR